MISACFIWQAFLASQAWRWLSRGYQLAPLDDEPRQPLFRFLTASLREYSASRPLAPMWFAYLFWNSSIAGLGNLSLYARQALGRDPMDFSGRMIALRFGCKSLRGYALGAIALRSGLRASASFWPAPA